ncbi:MAG TPA: twin-arginine translocase TatA/TatE family subunit [Gemmatimonadales bacterium]|nr:twin-arginine translocase TatA/TatE family subunit [Gemmatimonadales bacterium]
MSGGEVVLLAVVAVGALGGRQLPAAKRALGRGLQRFQRTLNEARREIDPDDRPAPRRRPTRLID